MSAIKKSLKSFRYAFTGVFMLVKGGNNMMIHLLTAFLVIILSFILQLSYYEWCLIVFCIGFVIAAEGFNTAIEKLVDKISPERNEVAGLVKDISAGAVLIAAITAAIIGIIVFTPKIIHFFNL